MLAVLAGYALNAVLVTATELLLTRLLRGLKYFVADLIVQCICSVASGCLCCRISLPAGRTIAASGLILLGLLIGGTSLYSSWNSEPRWYGTALICVWAPCVFLGYLIVRHRKDKTLLTLE